MNIPEALEMRLRAKRRDQKHRWYKKRLRVFAVFFCVDRQPINAWDRCPLRLLLGKTGGVPCRFGASVIHDSFWMQSTRAIHETAEASVEGLIEEAIRKIKKTALPKGSAVFQIQIILYSCFPYPTSRCLFDWGGHFYGRTVSECLP